MIPHPASFFGGTPNAIEWWKEVYSKYHDYWLFKRGAFVGQDRTIFNSLSLLFPGRIITVWPSDPHAPGSLEDEVNPLGMCGNMYVLISYPTTTLNNHPIFSSAPISTRSRWYFRYFLASRSERAFLKSGVWRIFTSVKECQLARVLGMEDVLRRDFGLDCNPPMAGLDLTMDYQQESH